MASGYSDLSEIRKDRGPYGLHQKPAKINLLNEKPRRESLMEQQLTSTIVRPTLNQPANYQRPLGGQLIYGEPQGGGSQQYFGGSSSQQVNYSDATDPHNYSGPGASTSKSTTTTTTTRTYNQLMSNTNPQQLPLASSTSPSPIVGPDGSSTTSYSYSSGPGQTTTVTTKVVRKLISDRQTSSSLPLREPPPIPIVENAISNNSRATTTKTTATPATTNSASNYTELVNELAEKEAKLRREMAYLNQHLSPWARPPQVRDKRREPQPRTARSEMRWVKECPSGSSSRPNSRASSTRSTAEADLMEKAAKLLQDVEELERKPMKTQQILIESGATRPRSSGSSSSISPTSGVNSSIHTAIIKVPTTEIDNKSPLPFAYDNFSTLGVRGNIASVGAAPPETPYPPIFPTIKRGQSPNELRRQ